MTEKVVIVTGGRTYSSYATVKRTLDLIGPTLVIQGGARGADELARRWCHENKAKCVTYDADWDGHGRAAGPMRNCVMLEENKTAAVVAFPGGAGTRDCMTQAAKKFNMLVLRVGGI